MITISFNQDLTYVRGYYCCLSQYYSSTYPWPAKWVWRALHLHMNLHCTRYGIAWSFLGLPAMQSWRQYLGKAKPVLVEAERRTKPSRFIVSPNHQNTLSAQEFSEPRQLVPLLFSFAGSAVAQLPQAGPWAKQAMSMTHYNSPCVHFIHTKISLEQGWRLGSNPINGTWPLISGGPGFHLRPIKSNSADSE